MELYQKYAFVALASFVVYVVLGNVFPKVWIWVKSKFKIDGKSQPIETFWDDERGDDLAKVKHNYLDEDERIDEDEKKVILERISQDFNNLVSENDEKEKKCQCEMCKILDSTQSQKLEDVSRSDTLETFVAPTFVTKEEIEAQFVKQEELRAIIDLVESINKMVKDLSIEVNSNFDKPNNRLGAMVRMLISNDTFLKEKFADINSRLFNLANNDEKIRKIARDTIETVPALKVLDKSYQYYSDRLQGLEASIKGLTATVEKIEQELREGNAQKFKTVVELFQEASCQAHTEDRQRNRKTKK